MLVRIAYKCRRCSRWLSLMHRAPERVCIGVERPAAARTPAQAWRVAFPHGVPMPRPRR